MIAKRIDVLHAEEVAQAAEHESDPDDNLEDDLGPNFNDMGDLPNARAPENELGNSYRASYAGCK